MVVLMEVLRVGAEAEAEMMTVDTHVATEIVRMSPPAETEIFIVVVAELAHVLGAQTDTTDLGVIEVTDVIETT
jgi:hypothetical protein